MVQNYVSPCMPKNLDTQVLPTKEWGDAKSMLCLIAHMWKIKITLINYMGYDVEFIVFGLCKGEGHAHFYIIYNGWSHYTATGTAFALHTTTHPYYRNKACFHVRFLSLLHLLLF